MKYLLLFAVLLLPTPAIADEIIAPSFDFIASDGTEMRLPGDQEGIGVYLFWASWCPYCRALMPHLQSISDEYGDSISIYTLNFRDEEDPDAYISGRGFDFISMNNADEVAELWGAHGTPAVFLVDGEGAIRFNLYELLIENPPEFDQLSHRQKAQRRAPLWAARIRQALDALIDEVGS